MSFTEIDGYGLTADERHIDLVKDLVAKRRELDARRRYLQDLVAKLDKVCIQRDRIQDVITTLIRAIHSDCFPETDQQTLAEQRQNYGNDSASEGNKDE